MELFGIKFVPLNEPLERRLQTLAAAIWMVIVVLGTPVFPIILLCVLVFTPLWWLVPIYLCWYLFFDTEVSEHGGRPSKWVRTWQLWRYCRDYFPLRLEKIPGVELDAKKNYLFCCFPHGVVAIGVFNAFATEWAEFERYFPHHTPRIATLSQNYLIPLFRELALSFGGVSSSAKSIDYVLGRPGGGYVCTVVVGGAAEALRAKPGRYRLVLRNRKGFVKLALRNGAPLVPVLSFGETDLFDQWEEPRLRRVQEVLKQWLKFSLVVPIGRGFFQYSFGIIPKRRKVTTVVGVPLEVPKIQNPSKEQIDHYHGEFIKKLLEMFEEQKHNYLENPEDTHLIIE